MRDDPREIAVETVEWSFRTENVLNNQGIKTLGELADLTPRQMLRWANFGRVSLAEVEKTLVAHHLSPRVDPKLEWLHGVGWVSFRATRLADGPLFERVT